MMIDLNGIEPSGPFGWPQFKIATITLKDNLSAYIGLLVEFAEDRDDPPDSALWEHIKQCTRLLDDIRGWDLGD